MCTLKIAITVIALQFYNHHSALACTLDNVEYVNNHLTQAKETIQEFQQDIRIVMDFLHYHINRQSTHLPTNQNVPNLTAEMANLYEEQLTHLKKLETDALAVMVNPTLSPDNVLSNCFKKIHVHTHGHDKIYLVPHDYNQPDPNGAHSISINSNADYLDMLPNTFTQFIGRQHSTDPLHNNYYIGRGGVLVPSFIEVFFQQNPPIDVTVQHYPVTSLIKGYTNQIMRLAKDFAVPVSGYYNSISHEESEFFGLALAATIIDIAQRVFSQDWAHGGYDNFVREGLPAIGYDLGNANHDLWKLPFSQPHFDVGSLEHARMALYALTELGSRFRNAYDANGITRSILFAQEHREYINLPEDILNINVETHLNQE